MQVQYLNGFGESPYKLQTPGRRRHVNYCGLCRVFGVASPLSQAAHNPIALTLVSTSPWLHVGKGKETFRAGKGGQ